MSLREIRKFDDPILRKKCKFVPVVDERIRMLLDDMVETMHSMPNAVGLAASQVGILKRLVVIDFDGNVIKLVNPEIISSEGEQIGTEGCLSFPGRWGNVHRPKKVSVQALNEKGETIVVEGKDFMARCLCHELDHLDGIVFIDKISEVREL